MQQVDTLEHFIDIGVFELDHIVEPISTKHYEEGVNQEAAESTQLRGDSVFAFEVDVDLFAKTVKFVQFLAYESNDAHNSY